MANWNKKSSIWWTGFDVDVKEKALAELEAKTQTPHFWEDSQEAAKISQQISSLKEELAVAEHLKKALADVKELAELGHVDERAITHLKKHVEQQEFRIFLSEPYDKNNAIMEIFSGAGGVEAQDWTTMLLRMYQRYCDARGWQTEILHQSFGEGGGPEGRIGTKSVTFEIRGSHAYGFLKKESGVHRLVRQSPFSAQKLRHTSFAQVQVLPEIKEVAEDMQINPVDLRVDTFRASGPGGQYVNKTESAIRITHIPTGLVVASQSERSQGRNREHAMSVLYAKLHALKQQQQAKELKDIKGEQMTTAFGSQIRSYVLHPYKMVKDLRTQYETSQAEKVLDGDLEEFIQAELKLGE